MYATFYRTVRKLLVPGERAVYQYLRELEQTQWLSKDALAVWQFERLQAVLQHAYEHVPYYRDLYQREDIHPQDIKSFKDFEALPFLTKEDITQHLNELVASNFEGKLWPNETGGSTGQPMRFYLDDTFYHWNVALKYRAHQWFGVKEGEKEAWIWGAARDMPEWDLRKRILAWIRRRRYLNAFAMTESKMQAFAEMLRRWRPVMIRAYPSALALFAVYLKEHQIMDIHPHLIELTAEKVTIPQRELFEKVFHCPVADWYSSRELATIAYQCEAGGLHVCEPRYVELIANSLPVFPGQLGEVVVTSLTQYAMPLIRYKLGDMGVYQGEVCSCGRAMPVLQEVVGRTHDYLVTVDGQFVHGEFFAYTFRVKPEVVRYQIYQPDREHLKVRLVCKQQVDALWLESVKREIQDRFGTETQISIQVVEHIALTPAGKHRFIISEVKPDFL